ncbi:tRNA guanosine(34) transglycosylase Tgt [candidate division WOR-3 bacterium]|nr:tRNA guanosine(34) transglycosylase Tgt [candidate division WOR-3 bacterium]
MNSNHFEITAEDKNARTGILHTKSGDIETPAFMPVATLGDIKTLPSWDLRELGVQLFISNIYHLHLRPGEELIKNLGGLHSFMDWDKPIATDSGGFQVYSLAARRIVQDDGILFSSHIDGSPLRFTPEKVLDIQMALGSDVMMPLDECVGYPIGKGYAKEATQRTNKWAYRAANYFKTADYQGLLFGIIQGSTYTDLRIEAAREIADIGFDGYAIGGLVVGESNEQTWEVLNSTIPCLPRDYPRYTMGFGKVGDILKGVMKGIDLFDCVIPTRNARTGAFYTREGKINIINSRFKDDPLPISEECRCPTCQHYSRAYIRHLFNSNEILAKYLATVHNIFFYMQLMKDIRKHIKNGTIEEWSGKILNRYKGGFDV